ncbi:MAG: hypothetical protein IJ488_03175 [Clostridia bacterium]|nr:hypothetical protein [Clostridia bacterium]
MKNSRASKLLILAFSLILLIGSALGIAISAEGENTYEIAKINISHGDRTYVLMAVDAPVADAASIEVKYSYGGSDYVAEYDGTSTVVIDEVTYPVFYTHGISPKDIGEDIIAEAHAKGAVDYTPVEYNVSIAEYLYNMLYAQGYVNATVDTDKNLKALYEAHIAYGAAAQQALWNDVEDTDRTLITERSYVYSAYATINESGARELLLPAKNGNVTLTKNADYPAEAIGWTVTTYNADGTTTVTEYKDTNTVSISGHSVITPLEQRIINFENASVGAVTGIDGLTSTAIDAASSVSIAIDPKNSDNKAIFIDANGSAPSYDGGNVSVKVTPIDGGVNANCYVVDFDILMINPVNSNNSPVQFWFYNSSGNKFTGVGLKYMYQSDNVSIVKTNTAGTDTAGTYDTGKTYGEWMNVRLEYYSVEGIVEMWYGDKYQGYTNAVITGADASSFGFIQFYTAGECGMDVYIDNIVCESIVKEYTPGNN